MIDIPSLTNELLIEIGVPVVTPNRDPELVVIAERNLDGTCEMRSWSVRACSSASDLCSEHPHGLFTPDEVIACRRMAKSIVDGACLAGSAIVLFAHDDVGNPAVHTFHIDVPRHREIPE